MPPPSPPRPALLEPTLTHLRRYNLYNTLTKEVFGSNFPHVLGVMNFNEFVDQAINQFGNTLGVGLGGLAADRLIDKAFLALHPTVFKAGPTQAQRTLQSNPATHPHAQQWYELGKSAAVYATIATFLIANPFIRNYITSQRTKASSFVDMVGLENNDTGTESQQAQQARLAKEQGYLHTFASIVVGGATVAAAALATAHHGIAKGLAVPKALQALQRVALPQGDFRHGKDIGFLLFWGIPAYIGLITGSRDMVELQENCIKPAGYALAVYILPRTIEKLINQRTAGKHYPLVGPGKNMAFLGQLLSGIVFYGSMPTFINLVSRPARAKAAGFNVKEAPPTVLGITLGPSQPTVAVKPAFAPMPRGTAVSSGLRC